MCNQSERLERANVILSRTDRMWLEQITQEMRATGADVSRSEIIRAALAAFKELHAVAPELVWACHGQADLELVGIAAMRALRYTPLCAELK